MHYEKVEMSIIIPFYYNTSFYETLAEHFAEYFNPINQTMDMLNEYAEQLCTVSPKNLFRCFKLTDKCRAILGIHKKENAIYYISENTSKNVSENPKILFSIAKMYAWFRPGGNGFLTFHIKANHETLTAEQVFTLKKSLTKINDRKKCIELISEERQKKYNLTPKTFTIKSIKKAFFEIIQPIFPMEQQNTTHEAHSLLFNIVSQIDTTTFSNYLERLRTNYSVKQMSATIADDFHFIPEPYPYLHWTTSEKALSVTVDIEHGENPDFLYGNFIYSVFKNYLIFYLYYISMQNNYTALDIQYKKAEQKLALYPTKKQLSTLVAFLRPLAESSQYSHINTLFMEYLCNNTWNLIENTQLLENTYGNREIASKHYDIFISYRRKYGGYIALHIFKYLQSIGYNPFLDLVSLGYGPFDEQLYEKISKSNFVISVLTPNCLDKCNEIKEEDWIYKELYHALQEKKVIIPILIDGFEFPENLAEELSSLKKQHGTEMTIQYIDSALKNISNLLENQKRDFNRIE